MTTIARMLEAAFILSLTPLFALASPQFNSPSYPFGPLPPANPSTSSTSTGSAAAPSAPPSTSSQINVDVAFQGQLVFNPATITASNGTTITFYFPAGDTPHSVTQSTFADPCSPLTGSSGTGFDSGLTSAKQFTLQVTDDTQPVWFFCKSPTHCGMGMVGSINAPSSGDTFDKYQAAAKAIGSSEATIQDNGPVIGGVGAIATATPTAAASSSSGSSSSDASRVVVNGGLFMAITAAAIVLIA